MLSSVGTIPYRRLTDPLILPVAATSTRTAVPASFIPSEATSFRVTNPNAFWVRLKGATGAAASSLTIGATEGWLFPPGFSGTFTTQFPEAMATIAVGSGAGNGTLEISYGVGGGGESAFLLSSSGSGSVPTGPAGTPNSNVLTVQGIAGGTVQPVSGTVAVSNFPANQTVTSRGTATMATGQVNMAAGNTPYLVAAARSTRRSITFVPTSQFTYFYGNAAVSTTSGACAPNGAAITLETTAAVYVVSGSTGTMTFVEHY